MMPVRTAAFVALAFTAAVILGCGGTSSSFSAAPQAGAIQNLDLDATSPSSPSPIAHVVIMIQENRTFNDFFATYPGADGTTVGKVAKNEGPGGCKIRRNKTIPLTESNLIIPSDLNHSYQAYHIAYANGKMNGFDLVKFQTGKPECTYPYQYTNPSQIQPYWAIAKQYVLAEHMFTTQGSSSFVAHQDLIRGGSAIDATDSIVNDPTQYPWGCDAPPHTKTSLITQDNQFYPQKGPFPCSKDFPNYGSNGYKTLRDLLDAKSISWKYYLPPWKSQFGKLMSAFDVIAPVRYGPEWNTNISTPQTNIFNDISGGTLPSVSWLIPDEPESDHPGQNTDTGPQWVASVVNAIGESSYWNSTAIIIVWDDWGGLYDNLAPPQLGFGGLGFRVPALIVSPYARAGYISPTQYEFGSILLYIEKNWNLGSLGTSDARAKSIIDSFNYLQKPIPFTTIPSSLSKSYFMHQKPSYLPVDTDM
jgi:phospholipase C